eukprot:gb/GEZN01007424.1/.p1 GENE.gb/GEZN01007424.1/~~gb/GEZN01007424.1/.p1  ORF type:complete len:388 (-),score=15.52 gb/GEZN01007424.1/:225-1388(-)
MADAIFNETLTSQIMSLFLNGSLSIRNVTPAPLGSHLPLRELIIRIVAATCFGGLLGFEREWKHGRERVYGSAGFRTQMIVCVSCCLLQLISAYGYEEVGAATGPRDPSRLATGCVTGIGFLGAGVIFKTDSANQLIGLTTAATLFASMAIGLATGVGWWAASISMSLIMIFILDGVKLLKRICFPNSERRFRCWIELSGGLEARSSFFTDVYKNSGEVEIESITHSRGALCASSSQPDSVGLACTKLVMVVCLNPKASVHQFEEILLAHANVLKFEIHSHKVNEVLVPFDLPTYMRNGSFQSSHGSDLFRSERKKADHRTKKYQPPISAGTPSAEPSQLTAEDRTLFTVGKGDHGLQETQIRVDPGSTSPELRQRDPAGPVSHKVD